MDLEVDAVVAHERSSRDVVIRERLRSGSGNYIERSSTDLNLDLFRLPVSVQLCCLKERRCFGRRRKEMGTSFT